MSSIKSGPITDWPEYLKKAKIDFSLNMSRSHKDQDVKLSDFHFIRTLGRGGFGRVILAELKSKGHFYAAKLQEKKVIVKYNLVKNLYNEKKLLQSFRFPFLLNMDYFFQDNVYLYFMMPVIEGGDLFNVLQSKGKFDEHLARFYAAQVLLALEYMHYLELVYRDIKPENILLDREGFIRVVDYGFVKYCPDRTYSFCGTPDYIAPEIIQHKGYGRSADYWSFGVLLYEFNSGVTPFYSKNQTVMFEKIVDVKYSLKDYFTPELKGIIQNLLQKDLTRRFGNLRRGIQDIKDHKWFNRISWLAVANKSIVPPFAPPSSGFFEKYDEKPLETRPNDPYADHFANF